MVYDDKQFNEYGLATHIREEHEYGSMVAADIATLIAWSRWELENAHHQLGECIAIVREELGEAS